MRVHGRRRGDWVPVAAALVTGGIAAANLVAVLARPLPDVPLFHELVVPASAALLLAAGSLARRRRRAWQAAVALLLALGAVDLLKGPELGEAALSLGGAAVLVWGREAFTAHHAPGSLRSSLWKVPALAAATGVLSYLVVWSTAPAEPSARTVARETADLLAWTGGPVHYTDERSWVPVAVGLLGIGALLAAARVVFRPLGLRRQAATPAVRAAAAALVRAHGSDTLSFFKLRGDTGCFFGADRRAFAGYTVEGTVLVVSGDPVGPPDALEPLVAELLQFAGRRGLTVAVVGASAGLLPVYRRAGLRAFSIGDEAVVETARFSLEGRAVRKVRQSVARLGRAGFAAELRSLGELAPAELDELDAVSAAWRRGVPERGFSMALDSLRGPHLEETAVVVARGPDGAVRGFLHFVPAYGRPAMSLSSMRWDRSAPNGLSEYLVVRAIELLRDRGVEELSLNFAAFARLLHEPGGTLRRLLARTIALGNPFFQIESLYRFNAKFAPRWTPRYLVYERALALPRAGLAVMRAEGQLPRPTSLTRARRL